MHPSMAKKNQIKDTKPILVNLVEACEMTGLTEYKFRKLLSSDKGKEILVSDELYEGAEPMYVRSTIEKVILDSTKPVIAK